MSLYVKINIKKHNRERDFLFFIFTKSHIKPCNIYTNLDNVMK